MSGRSYPPDHLSPQARSGAPTPVGKVRPMLTAVAGAAAADGPRPTGGSDSLSLIDEIVREGARRMLAEALQAEVEAYLAQFRHQREEQGRRLVVCNGSHQPRDVLTAAGPVEVVAPRVNDRHPGNPPDTVADLKSQVSDLQSQLAQNAGDNNLGHRPPRRWPAAPGCWPASRPGCCRRGRTPRSRSPRRRPPAGRRPGA